MPNKPTKRTNVPTGHYGSILGDISNVIDTARRSASRSVNSIMTAAYWLVGRRIVESEQKGEKRAAYGEELLERLSVDLGERFGRGFSRQNLQQMRQFYLLYQPEEICQTASGESGGIPSTMIFQTLSGILRARSREISLADIARCFPPEDRVLPEEEIKDPYERLNR